MEVISTTLKACLGVLLILGLREYSRKYYTTFVGVFPEKWYSASGSSVVLFEVINTNIINNWYANKKPTVN